MPPHALRIAPSCTATLLPQPPPPCVSPSAPQNADDESSFEEFWPMSLRQHAGKPAKDFEKFDTACDEFFSLVESQRRVAAHEAQVKAVMSKVDKVTRLQFCDCIICDACRSGQARQRAAVGRAAACGGGEPHESTAHTREPCGSRCRRCRYQQHARAGNASPIVFEIGS